MIAEHTFSVQEVWQRTCELLKMQLSGAVYNTWIVSNPLTSLQIGEDNTYQAIITSPTAFHSTNIKKNLHVQISQALEKILQKQCSITYQVGTAVQEPEQHFSKNFSSPKQVMQPSVAANHYTQIDNRTPIHASIAQNSNTAQSPRVEDLFSPEMIQSVSEDRLWAITRNIGLRKDYTFQSFAVSTTNEMAHAAATAVSNRPGVAYNPLFLYGGVGVGKTHLMHAIGHNILKSNPDAKIIYCTGEEFTNDIVQAIQKKQAGQFKSKYRNAAALLIDDIQFIAGKNAVQEEFFHTFNALTKQQSQVVLTSDRPPHEMNLLEDRLRSRFEAGLMIDIQQPSFELRTAILLVKAKAAHLPIPIEIAKNIAAKVESARKIEGIITSIRSEVELKGRSITNELIDELLKIEGGDSKRSITASPSDIIKTVADHYKLKQTALKGKRRVKSLVTARHLAMYLLKNELNLPLVEIGRWFSGRDHTSVLHAVKKIEHDLQIDDLLKRDLSALKTTLVLTAR